MTQGEGIELSELFGEKMPTVRGKSRTITAILHNFRSQLVKGYNMRWHGKDGIAELGARSRVMRWNSADGHKPFPRCDIVRAPMLGCGHGWLPSSDAIMTGCRIVARSQKYSASFPLSPAPPPERRWCRIYMHLPSSCTKFWCILSALLHRNPLLCFGACLD